MDASSENVTSLDQLELLHANGRLSEEDYAVLRSAFDDSGRRIYPRPQVERTRGRWGKSWTNRQLGGVCGGIAEAFGVDAWALRGVFILALLISAGSAFLIYALLYLVLPWKEDERHLVWRFPTGFFLAVIFLWICFFVLNQWYAPLLRMMYANYGNPLSTFVLWVFRIEDYAFTWVGVALQLAAAIVVSLMYGIAPSDGATRRLLAFVVCGGLLVIDATTLILYMSWPHLR